MKQRKTKQKTNKKNLRRISAVITAQTLWHLYQICAINGWGAKDIGRAIDAVVKVYCTERGDFNG